MRQVKFKEIENGKVFTSSICTNCIFCETMDCGNCEWTPCDGCLGEHPETGECVADIVRLIELLEVLTSEGN